MAEIKKVSYTHDAMIDLVIADPSISQGRIAAYFGYTPAWISQVMSSDAFKERLAERRGEIVDPRLKATLDERFEAVVTRSLDVLLEKLSTSPDLVPDQLALQAAQLGAKALNRGGFGRSETNVSITNNSLTVQERNARVAQRLSSLVREAKGANALVEVIDVQSR